MELLVKIFDQKSKIDTRGGKYKNPRVFTEQGVTMQKFEDYKEKMYKSLIIS